MSATKYRNDPADCTHPGTFVFLPRESACVRCAWCGDPIRFVATGVAQ